jgi:hypothetical protein
VETVAALACDHEVLGDELLEVVPGWVHDAAGGDVLPVTDVGRLLVLQDRLRTHDRVVWLDADVVVFAPEHVSFAVDADLAVCREVWVTGGPAGSLRAVDLVCNAAIAARPGGVDDLLERTLAAVRPGMGRRALGPDLLTVLHRARPFATVPGVTLFSPMVVADLAAGGGDPFRCQLAAEPRPFGAANLCASMNDDPTLVARALDVLLRS